MTFLQRFCIFNLGGWFGLATLSHQLDGFEVPLWSSALGMACLCTLAIGRGSEFVRELTQGEKK